MFTITTFTIPSLFLSHNHKIEALLEMHLMVSDSARGVEKTNDSIKVLK